MRLPAAVRLVPARELQTGQRGIKSYPRLASGETHEGERPHNALWPGTVVRHALSSPLDSSTGGGANDVSAIACRACAPRWVIDDGFVDLACP